MKKLRSAVIFLAVIVLLSGCQSSANTINNQNENQNLETNKQLTNKISELEEENQRLNLLYEEANKRLEEMYDQDNMPLSVSYIGYEEQYRFIKDHASILWMPEDNSPVVCALGNTIVEVLFAGYTTEEDIWLFVSFRTYDTPSNNRGWIREKNTVKYTSECQKSMTDIIIQKGTMDSDNNPASVEDYDRYGMIEKREGDKVLVMFAGGDEHWYYEKDISYPPLEYDFSVCWDNKSIALKDWDKDNYITNILGQPKKESVVVLGEGADTHTGSCIKTLEYEGLVIKLFSAKDYYWIMSMEVTDKRYKTSKGITVGSSVNDLNLNIMSFKPLMVEQM